MSEQSDTYSESYDDVSACVATALRLQLHLTKLGSRPERDALSAAARAASREFAYLADILEHDGP